MSPDLQADIFARAGPGLSTHPDFRPGVLPQAELRQGPVEVPRLQVSHPKWLTDMYNKRTDVLKWPAPIFTKLPTHIFQNGRKIFQYYKRGSTAMYTLVPLAQ